MGNFNRDRSFGGSKRSNFGTDNRNNKRPELFKAICDECSKECEVPFRPSNNKPIYCSDCFRIKDGSKNERSFDTYSRDRWDKRMRNNFSTSWDRIMYKAICDECNKECEIPFKPQNDKPIYCSDCFSKNNKTKNIFDSKQEFDNLNTKLDLIIKFFKISEIKQENDKVETKKNTIEIKEKAPKKSKEIKEIKIKKVTKTKKA